MLRNFKSCFRPFRQKPVDTVQGPPTVEWLQQHRRARAGQRAVTQGATPLASLYRMYEYLVVGHIAGLRSEVEYFFNQASWIVADIPDPTDPDPARYAILAVLPQYLVVAFNRLIERGLPRGSPAIIMSSEAEDELQSRDVVLEKEPSWALKVPRLTDTLVITGNSILEPDEECRSARFLEMNILVAEPHVLFV